MLKTKDVRELLYNTYLSLAYYNHKFPTKFRKVIIKARMAS